MGMQCYCCGCSRRQALKKLNWIREPVGSAARPFLPTKYPKMPMVLRSGFVFPSATSVPIEMKAEPVKPTLQLKEEPVFPTSAEEWIAHHSKAIVLMVETIAAKERGGDINDCSAALITFFSYLVNHYENPVAPLKKTHMKVIDLARQKAVVLLGQLPQAQASGLHPLSRAELERTLNALLETQIRDMPAAGPLDALNLIKL